MNTCPDGPGLLVRVKDDWDDEDTNDDFTNQLREQIEAAQQGPKKIEAEQQAQRLPQKQA
jgi:non-homologous end joining protein Ku